MNEVDALPAWPVAYDEPSGSTTKTLAASLLALQASSPCFCCGSELLAPPPSPSHSLVLLKCPRCGAQVEAEGEPAGGNAAQPVIVVAA